MMMMMSMEWFYEQWAMLLGCTHSAILSAYILTEL